MAAPDHYDLYTYTIYIHTTIAYTILFILQVTRVIDPLVVRGKHCTRQSQSL